MVEFPAHRFLIAKLGGNLPIRDLFATITQHVSFRKAFTFCRVVDDGVIRYRFLAIWAYNLVFHLLVFLINA